MMYLRIKYEIVIVHYIVQTIRINSVVRDHIVDHIPTDNLILCSTRIIDVITYIAMELRNISLAHSSNSKSSTYKF